MSPLIAEVISIGDELTSGQRLDTNSQWLSVRLAEIGVRVLFHATVADDLEANVRVFQTAVERADIVVATGGLGPTADDLTRQVLARLAGVELRRNDAVLAEIRALFARRGREMPERNAVQALFPEGSQVIPNHQGTAPGIALVMPREGDRWSHVFALPGVPAEMFRMWTETVAPQIVSLAGPASVIRHRVIKCFGAGESEVEQMLPDLIRRGRDPLVGITVSGATISLRIATSGATVEECDARIQPTVDEIYRTLGTLVYGEGEVELDVATANLLRERGQTLATVEFGTAGLIAHWLAAASADEAPWAGSMVAASSAQISQLLGLPSKSPPGSAFAAWIEQAARAVRARFSASLGLAACADSVVAGDLNALRAAGKTSGGGPDLPRLWIGLDDGAKVISRSFVYAGPDALVAPRAAKQALNLVRLRLQGAL